MRPYAQLTEKCVNAPTPPASAASGPTEPPARR